MASRTAIAFLFAVLSFTCIHAQEHFLLNLRWPGGICSKGECCYPSSFPRQDDFLVQYLAHSNGTGSEPECRQTRFYYNALQTSLDDLKKYWPSLACPSDIGFRDWESIWNDNGVCTGLSQADYFTKALALRESANLLNILAQKGIKPSNDVSYQLSDVENAINEGLGGVQTAKIHCGSKKSPIIRNVRLCVDKTATSFINCPNKKPSVCKQTVKLQKIPESSLNDEL